MDDNEPDYAADDLPAAAHDQAMPNLGRDATFEEIRQALTTPRPAPSTPPVEPYRPDMLPRTALPDEPPRYTRRFDDPGETPAPSHAARSFPQPAPERSEPAPSIRREPGLSLRESILKKPLSSLYKKD